METSAAKSRQTLWIGLVLLLGGCTPINDFREELLALSVQVDADDTVAAELDDVEVTVESRLPDANSWALEKSNRFTPVPGVASDWPLLLRLTQFDPRASYQATATARDQAGAITIQARALVEPRSLAKPEIKLRFDRECLRRSALCARAQTCVLGQCADAREPLRERRSESESDSMDAQSESAEVTTEQAAGAIDVDCMQRAAGERFCNAQGKMLECQENKTATVRPCDDNEQCTVQGAEVMCACRPGFVPNQQGCIEATDCRDRGGCDLLTECQLQNGVRTCTPCPVGFSGSGEAGCLPLLSGLIVSPGVIDPDFDPQVTRYRVRLSSLAQRVTLTAQSEADVSLSINSAPAALNTAWTSSVLRPGVSTVRVTLSASTGARRDYDIELQQTEPLQHYVKASNGHAGDWFGSFVAADGDTLVVGAPYEAGGSQQPEPAAPRVMGAGAAYVYVRRGERWEQQGYLKADQPSGNALFGVSVAISKDRIAVGAPGNFPASFTSGTTSGAVYVFARNQGSWSLQQKLVTGSSGDGLGFRVALHADTLIASAPFDSERESYGGAAHSYAWNGTVWEERQRLAPPTAVSQAQFGGSLAMDADTLAIAAWMEDTTSAVRAGAVYVYTRTTAGWSFLQRVVSSAPRTRAHFGTGLAVLGDQLGVGAPHGPIDGPSTHSGGVLVFSRDGAEYRAIDSLEAANPQVGDRFGQHVSLLPGRLAVSAPGDSNASSAATGEALPGSGAVFLYAWSGQDYVRSGYVKASNADAGDGFGNTIALTDDYLVSCAVFEDSATREINGDAADNTQEDSGAVYVLQ